MLITALSENHEVWDLVRAHAFFQNEFFKNESIFKMKMKTRMYAEAGEWGN